MTECVGEGGGDTTLGNGKMSRPSIHCDAVVTLAAIQPGLCLSGSKDKVCGSLTVGTPKRLYQWSAMLF